LRSIWRGSTGEAVFAGTGRIAYRAGTCCARRFGGSPASPVTATPIAHLIVVVGENLSFDNLFGIYEPSRAPGIHHLLSEGIVRSATITISL
jgi:phospholipase C